MSKPYCHYVNSSTTEDEEKRRIALLKGHNGISDQACYARGNPAMLEEIHQGPAAPETQENALTGNP